MEEKNQIGMAGFDQNFLPSNHARTERLEIETPSSKRKKNTGTKNFKN